MTAHGGDQSPRAGGRLGRRALLLRTAAVGAVVVAARSLPPLAAGRLGGAIARVRAQTTPAAGLRYALPGPQVEAEASYWTVAPLPLPGVVRVSALLASTDDAAGASYFPPYPSEEETAREIAELHELAALRDDPSALSSRAPGRERLPISAYLQLRPQPLAAVYDRSRGPTEPVITTGRELARWFESETPGLGHRLALDHLIRSADWSVPRQARAWMALDTAIYSALVTAWHYKWFSDRTRVAYRPRPVEVDPNLNVLYDHAVNTRTGAGDLAARVFPAPSPGTPRHPSYPSGHSTMAGAASETLSYFFPENRAEFDLLADNCGMARLWAGVHYRSDHLRGVTLGRQVGRAIVAQLESGGVSPLRPICAVTPGTALRLSQTPGPQQGAGSAGTFCDGPPSQAELWAQAEILAREANARPS